MMLLIESSEYDDDDVTDRKVQSMMMMMLMIESSEYDDDIVDRKKNQSVDDDNDVNRAVKVLLLLKFEDEDYMLKMIKSFR